MAKIFDNTGFVLYADDSPTIKETLEAAVKNGVRIQYANLNGVDLQNSNLYRANLTYCDMRDSNLSCSDLGCANLKGTDFKRSNMSYCKIDNSAINLAYLDRCNLRGSNLMWSDVSGSCFRGSDLKNVNFNNSYLANAIITESDVSHCDFEQANLDGVNFYGTNAIGANFTGAKLPKFFVCPEVGSFTAFKRLCDNKIAVIVVPSEARRTSSLVGRRCRCEFAMVLRIESVDGTHQFPSGVSIWDNNFVYTVGETVRANSYNDDIRVEYGGGIHFVITKQEAIDF